MRGRARSHTRATHSGGGGCGGAHPPRLPHACAAPPPHCTPAPACALASRTERRSPHTKQISPPLRIGTLLSIGLRHPKLPPHCRGLHYHCRDLRTGTRRGRAAPARGRPELATTRAPEAPCVPPACWPPLTTGSTAVARRHACRGLHFQARTQAPVGTPRLPAGVTSLHPRARPRHRALSLPGNAGSHRPLKHRHCEPPPCRVLRYQARAEAPAPRLPAGSLSLPPGCPPPYLAFPFPCLSLPEASLCDLRELAHPTLPGRGCPRLARAPRVAARCPRRRAAFRRSPRRILCGRGPVPLAQPLAPASRKIGSR